MKTQSSKMITKRLRRDVSTSQLVQKVLDVMRINGHPFAMLG
jgi:hypothetical protein